MPRRPRIHYPGAAYHAMARGVDGRSIFEDDIDRRRFMESLQRTTTEAKASVIAHCLMGNHFHLLVKVHRVPLSAILHRILTRYAQAFNMRHGRTGHLFQARYKATVVLDDRYLLRLVTYIHQNPVRAGLVPTASAWEWSSAAADHPADAEGILGMAADDPLDGAFDPWMPPDGTDGALFRNVPDTGPANLPFEECLQEVGHDDRFLRSRQRDASHTDARRKFVHAAIRREIAVAAIARWLGVHRAAVQHLAKPKFFNELAA